MGESALCSCQQQVSPVSLTTEDTTSRIPSLKAVLALQKPSGPFSVTCIPGGHCSVSTTKITPACSVLLEVGPDSTCPFPLCFSGSRFVGVVHVGAMASESPLSLSRPTAGAFQCLHSTWRGFLGRCWFAVAGWYCCWHGKPVSVSANVPSRPVLRSGIAQRRVLVVLSRVRLCSETWNTDYLLFSLDLGLQDWLSLPIPGSKREV